MDTFIRTGSRKAAVGFTIPADPVACWTWQGSVDSSGYGQGWNTALRRVDKAHRAIWTLLHGVAPPRGSGMEIDHACGVRRCVNPDHLKLVTIAANRATRNMSNCRRAITHGTISGYGRKCRCEACRRAWTVYLRERRYAKRCREALAAVMAR
jgi:hypothetical protein